MYKQKGIYNNRENTRKNTNPFWVLNLTNKVGSSRIQTQKDTKQINWMLIRWQTLVKEYDVY